MPVSSPAIVPKKKAAKKAPAGKAEWVGDVTSTSSGTKFYRCEPGCSRVVASISLDDCVCMLNVAIGTENQVTLLLLESCLPGLCVRLVAYLGFSIHAY